MASAVGLTLGKREGQRRLYGTSKTKTHEERSIRCSSEEWKQNLQMLG